MAVGCHVAIATRNPQQQNCYPSTSAAVLTSSCSVDDRRAIRPRSAGDYIVRYFKSQLEAVWRVAMVDQIDWNSLYSSYLGLLSERFARTLRANSFEPPREVVAALANPDDEDARWLIEALRHEGKRPEGLKWFVASFFFRRSQTIAEIFFVPLLDAAVDEVNPSDNRSFVEPCMKHFGPRRVNEYLLSIVESGTDFRRAGAVNALYWSQVALSFGILRVYDDALSLNLEQATAESRTAYMALQDVWERKKRLFLETFVANASDGMDSSC
jgi:hypothetical protein